MKTTKIILSITLISVFFSCNNAEKQDETHGTPAATISETPGTGDVWAEIVESKTLLARPDYYDDAYWDAIHKNVDVQKMLTTIVDAVLSGKQKAYNIMTDAEMTMDEVKAAMSKNYNENVKIEGAPEYKGVTAADISQIFTREKLIFDKDNFRLEKKVSRLDFTIKKLNDQGESIGDQPLFYVKLN